MVSRRLRKSSADWSALGYDFLHRVPLHLAALGTGRPRVIATACWEFPIYSQTFVYEELTQLALAGFPLRFIYCKDNPDVPLSARFARLWKSRHKMLHSPAIHEHNFHYYSRTKPEKLRSLVELLSSASGLVANEIIQHKHFQQGLTFTRLAQAWRADYVHSYFFYEGTLSALIAAYLLDIPRGISCYADHMLDDYELKIVPTHLEHSDVVVATSRRIRQELTQMIPELDHSHVFVKPNAVDVKQLERAPQNSNGSVCRLICVSRIEPKKGLLDLVEAVARLRESGHTVILQLVGAPELGDEASEKYAEDLRQRIEALDLGSIVRLEGRKNLDEVTAHLSQADIFVAPFVETERGDKDGIPTSLLEAMASSLPTVVTDAGSITEVIRHDRDGIIVPQRSPGAMAEAIAGLISDPERQRRLARSALSRVREKFDVSVCEPRFHERIRTALSG